MKKKKLLSFMLLTLILTVCFYMVASAASEKVECEYAMDLLGGANVQSSEFASEGEVIGLKPDEMGTDAVAEYKISIAEDGKYTFVITYSAAAGDGMVRKADLSMDDERVALDMKQTESWEEFETISVEFKLTAGEHTLKLLSPSDYDNSAVKTPNIDFFTYEKTGDLPKVAETVSEPVETIIGETVETPLVEVIEPISNELAVAPKTSDVSIFIFVLLSVVSGIVLVRIKANKGRI